jgi:PPOX class probable F420-dependent enzyme
MADVIPQEFSDLVTREKRAFANLALVLNDGTPHVSPIWFDYKNGLVVINTARGRIKDKALHRHPYAALSILDPADSNRYLLMRGPVIEETEEGAWDQIDDLNLKYNGNRNFKRLPGQVRVTYKIKPEHVFGGT